MQSLYYSLENIPKSSLPTALSIGNFDGVHLGHQALLQHLVQKAKEQHALSAILTFSNHPSSILRANHNTQLLCTIEHKIRLLEQSSVSRVILLPFTKQFSQQSADAFLQTIKQALSFQTLILGGDAHIGKNREGDRLTVTALAKTLGFNVEYFPDFNKNGQRISSSLIRSCIQKGELKQAESLLGRPYSIYGRILKGNGRGSTLGFPTANLDVGGLCLPPFGVYAVSLTVSEKKFQGIANLGLAPTVRQTSAPLLEVHLFDRSIDLYDQTVDVHFYHFIRQEKRFDTLADLKKQITDDVIKAKQIHHEQFAF